MRNHLTCPSSAALAVICAAAGCDSGERAVVAPAPVPELSANGALGGTLLISAGFDDFWGEIYTMRPDGSELTQLTDVPGRIDDHAKWSPDGRRIAFVSDRTGNSHLYVMHADGSGLVQLTSGPDDHWFPTWSPNGRKIAFDRIERTGPVRVNVYVINVDGTGLTQITNSADGESQRRAVWSPNGQRLVYAKTSPEKPETDVWVMNADGTGQVPLLESSYADVATDWAPNGRILLARLVDEVTENIEIFAMNADGTGLTQLTDRPGKDWYAIWSWDMRRIALSYQDPEDAWGITDIWVMNADGSGLTAVTDTPEQWEWITGWRPRP